ncbi:MAG: Signal transduction histidine kinase containing PAS domain [Candidatus Methanohalarchaeum thermophilum]|uniref:Signal transduction histidine kinase containing PAS domain n=1 Tax=Methanohalarchaeum thermophilum TaxID=1903181 RepID=A0A1Q6DWS5_METT1|nr:MAG: Signal transduction histidine kinase containing PAS domain [Candidatus Methanohalarchaeum thermophilum]
MIYVFKNFIPILLLFTGFSIIFFSVYLYKKSQSNLKKTFLIFIASAEIWVFCHLLELISQPTSLTLLWGKLKYIGIVTLPTIWLNFALQYTGKKIR